MRLRYAKRRWAGLAAVFFLALPLAHAADPAAHIRNFGRVNANLYRGGEPTPEGLRELKSMGVKYVIDLRQTGRGTAAEAAEAKALGMRYRNIPFASWGAPSPARVAEVLSMLDKANALEPVFVHCRRGKDRTGTVIACYRIEHDGWDNGRALAEANRYGMSHAERGMREFVLRFSPLPAAPPAPKPY